MKRKMKKTKSNSKLQLELKFPIGSDNKISLNNLGKIININFRAEKRRNEITNLILNRTKSF